MRVMAADDSRAVVGHRIAAMHAREHVSPIMPVRSLTLFADRSVVAVMASRQIEIALSHETTTINFNYAYRRTKRVFASDR